MKKYEIFYNPLILELERIINSAETATFANALLENRLNSFIGFVEIIEEFIDELKNANTTKSLYTSFQTIYDEIDRFCQAFNDLPNLSGEKLLLQIKLRAKVIDSLISIGDIGFDEADLDPNLYTCNELTTKIDHTFFQNYNSADICNCGVFFSLDNLEELIQKLDTVQLNPEFWLLLFPTFDSATLELGHQYTLIKQSIPPAVPVVTDHIPDFLKLFIVSQGKVFHKVHKYRTSPQMFCGEKISINNDYRQHNEIIYVLNEYNSRDELITKYLTIYQIVENFMYKTIIVDLEKKTAGRIFSLRDFKLMYEKVDKKEIEAIEKLCKDVFLENIQPGIVFKDY